MWRLRKSQFGTVVHPIPKLAVFNCLKNYCRRQRSDNVAVADFCIGGQSQMSVRRVQKRARKIDYHWSIQLTVSSVASWQTMMQNSISGGFPKY
jgi:hypothetical protein